MGSGVFSPSLLAGGDGCKGEINTAANRAMGVEFQQIRQGDRPLLDYVLNRL
jgi:hypothetical protein